MRNVLTVKSVRMLTGIHLNYIVENVLLTLDL